MAAKNSHVTGGSVYDDHETTFLPAFFEVEQLPVGGNLEVERHFGSEQSLEFSHYSIEFCSQRGDVRAEVSVVGFQLAFTVFLLTSQRFNLSQQLIVLLHQQTHTRTHTHTYIRRHLLHT